MRKSNKRKKPPKDGGSWLQIVGTFLAGLAAFLKVILEFVIWLSAE